MSFVFRKAASFSKSARDDECAKIADFEKGVMVEDIVVDEVLRAKAGNWMVKTWSVSTGVGDYIVRITREGKAIAYCEGSIRVTDRAGKVIWEKEEWRNDNADGVEERFSMPRDQTFDFSVAIQAQHLLSGVVPAGSSRVRVTVSQKISVDEPSPTATSVPDASSWCTSDRSTWGHGSDTEENRPASAPSEDVTPEGSVAPCTEPVDATEKTADPVDMPSAHADASTSSEVASAEVPIHEPEPRKSSPFRIFACFQDNQAAENVDFGAASSSVNFPDPEVAAHPRESEAPGFLEESTICDESGPSDPVDMPGPEVVTQSCEEDSLASLEVSAACLEMLSSEPVDTIEEASTPVVEETSGVASQPRTSSFRIFACFQDNQAVESVDFGPSSSLVHFPDPKVAAAPRESEALTCLEESIMCPETDPSGPDDMTFAEAAAPSHEDDELASLEVSAACLEMLSSEPVDTIEGEASGSPEEEEASGSLRNHRESSFRVFACFQDNQAVESVGSLGATSSFPSPESVDHACENHSLPTIYSEVTLCPDNRSNRPVDIEESTAGPEADTLSLPCEAPAPASPDDPAGSPETQSNEAAGSPDQQESGGSSDQQDSSPIQARMSTQSWRLLACFKENESSMATTGLVDFPDPDAATALALFGDVSLPRSEGSLPSCEADVRASLLEVALGRPETDSTTSVERLGDGCLDQHAAGAATPKFDSESAKSFEFPIASIEARSNELVDVGGPKVGKSYTSLSSEMGSVRPKRTWAWPRFVACVRPENSDID
jgi:hypothetical protein